MRPARADRLDVTQEIAEAAGELGLEACSLELEQAHGELGTLGPDDRRAMLAALAINRGAVAHRQDGEGAAGQELLLGNAAMRQFMAGNHDDGDLIVRPGAGADAGILAHRAEAAFRRSDQSRRELPAALQHQLDLVGVAGGFQRFVRCDQLDVGAGGEAALDGRTQEPVLDDPAHRRGGLAVGGSFAVIEMQEEGARAPVMSGIRDADVEDGLGFGRHLVPHPQRLEQPLAGIGDGRGAAVEARLAHRLERQAVDQRGLQPCNARRQGKQAAIKAGADDREVEALFVHGRAHVWKMAG